MVGKGFSKKIQNTCHELTSTGGVLGSATNLIMVELEKLDVKIALSWRFKGNMKQTKGFKEKGKF